MKRITKYSLLFFVCCLCNFTLLEKKVNLALYPNIEIEKPSGINPMAAVQIPGYGIYLFRGNEYYKYKIIDNEKVLLAGYPKKLPGGWKGLPKSFHDGIDAAVYDPETKKSYFFKGNKYVRLSRITVDEGFENKRLPGNWKNLPATFAKDIDAATYLKAEDGKPGHIVLVKGDKFVSFSNFKLKVHNGNLKDLWNRNLKAPFDKNVKAMLKKKAIDNQMPGLWLFNENNYMSIATSHAVETNGTLKMSTGSLDLKTTTSTAVNPLVKNNSSSTPTTTGQAKNNKGRKWGFIYKMEDWKVKKYNLAAPDMTKVSADASVYIPEMGEYIFSGNKYYKYTIDKKGKPKLWKDYPKTLPGGWIGLPKNFQSGIDAAYYNSYNKKTYMFRGNQYIRLSGRKVDDGYPVSLPTNWKGLPKSFHNNIDAAFTLLANGKVNIVLIKNGWFVVYADSKKVATGKLRNLWKGIPPGYARNIDAVVFGGIGKNYLFAGDQCVLANGFMAVTVPEFTIKKMQGVESFGEPQPVDNWKLTLRNRPILKSADGDNNGIAVAVGKQVGKPHNKPYKKDKVKEEGDYVCTIKHVDEKKVDPENILMDPTSGVIWLGALVDGTSIPTGEYKLLDIPRNPSSISLLKVVEAKKTSAIITDLKQHVVDKKLNELLRSIPYGAIPNTASALKQEEVYSEKQFRLKFGGSYNAGVASVSTDIEIQSKSKKHRLVVELAQKCFTVQLDDIGSYKKWIKDPSKIDFYNTLPMYVSSITYGRRAFMSIETNESLKSFKMDVSGRYGPATAYMSRDNFEILKESTIRVYIVGGNNNKAAAGVSGNYNDFIKFVKAAPQTATDVVPVSYTMKFLKDKSNAKVSLASKYTVRNCSAYQRKWKATLDFIRVINASDGDISDHDEEIYGLGRVAFYDKNGKFLKGHNVWEQSCGGSIQINEGHTYLIQKNGRFTYPLNSIVVGEKEKSEGAYLLVGGKLSENDGCDSDDDFLGKHYEKIYINDVLGDGGTKQIEVKGFRNGRSDVSLTWTISTY